MFQGIFDILLHVLIEKSKALLIILSLGIIKNPIILKKIFIMFFFFMYLSKIEVMSPILDNLPYFYLLLIVTEEP